MDIDSEKFYVRIEQKTPEAGVYKTSHMWVSDGTCRAFMRMLQRMFEHGDQPRIIVRLRQEPATEEERRRYWPSGRKMSSNASIHERPVWLLVLVVLGRVGAVMLVVGK